MSFKNLGGEYAKEMEFMMRHPEKFGRRLTYSAAKDIPRILVVDDDPDVTALLGLAMRGLNVQTVLSSDGRDALEQLNKGAFDLILLDYNMPKLNGEQMLDQISQNSDRYVNAMNDRLPIITYSARGADLNVPREEGFYIFDHWQKPMKMSDLKSHMIMAVARLGL